MTSVKNETRTSFQPFYTYFGPFSLILPRQDQIVSSFYRAQKLMFHISTKMSKTRHGWRKIVTKHKTNRTSGIWLWLYIRLNPGNKLRRAFVVIISLW